MERTHTHAAPLVLLAAAGVNAAAGAYLFARPLPPDLPAALAAKFGGDESKVAGDLAALRGTATQVRGKGILLLGIGALLACAAGTADRRIMRTLAAFVAAGDVALLALLAREAAAGGPPPLPSERQAIKPGVAWAVLEAAALGSYALFCPASSPPSSRPA